jgi:leader peptidase (prepilin peptidase)/N-methyltransferase
MTPPSQLAALLPQHEWLSLAMNLALAAWLLAVGGCVGSFLNVLVYRLPLGLNIAYPGSRCPKCGAPIAGKDNIPVISWLHLRGRCRHCREPISWRYPLVEMLTGIVFFALAGVEVFTRGANLPTSGHYFSTSVELWSLYALQLVLLSLLIAAAGMAFDGQEMPWRLPLAAISLVLLATTIWPVLRPAESWTIERAPWTATLGEGLIGAFFGSLLGACVFAAGERHWRPACWGLAFAGVICGWQATPLLASAAAGLFLLASLFTKSLARLASWPACLAVALLGFLASWGAVHRATDFQRRADWPLVAGCAGLVLALSGAATFFRRRNEPAIAPLPAPMPAPISEPFVFHTEATRPMNGELADQAWRVVVEARNLAAGEVSSAECAIGAIVDINDVAPACSDGANPQATGSSEGSIRHT